MANAKETSPASDYLPRPPTREEQRQLADFLVSLGEYEADDARSIAEAAYVAVYEHYSTGGPGYCGKLMSVVWDGSPSTFDIFTYRGGEMVRSGREYDEKECDRCGAKNASLCVNCWKLHERRPRPPEATALAHTPGFWEAYSIGKGNPDRYIGLWESEERYMVGAFDSLGTPRTSKTICLLDPVRECEANARLIALSPRMADALLEAFDLFRGEIDAEVDHINGNNFLDAFLYWRASHEHLLNRLEGRS
jgi:hypothetical protein